MFIFQITWQCKRKDIRCPARLHTVNGYATSFKNEHIGHAADAATLAASSSYAAMTEAARTTPSTNHNIIASFSQNMSAPVAAALPSIETMKRRMRRARSQVQNALPIPNTLRELHIPEELKNLPNGDLFVLYDSGEEDADRFIIFGTQRGLQLLAQAIYWCADGTYKTVPSLFNQLYTLFGMYLKTLVPALFILATRHTEACYIRILLQIMVLCPTASPTRITTDFEIGAINAFSAVFPQAESHGCNFHFKQIINGKIKNAGLQALYNNDPEFALHAKMIGALAFVPVQYVIDAYQCVAEHVNEALEPVLAHLEEYYIGSCYAGTNVRRTPR